jgi:hypothetical protein
MQMAGADAAGGDAAAPLLPTTRILVEGPPGDEAAGQWGMEMRRCGCGARPYRTAAAAASAHGRRARCHMHASAPASATTNARPTTPCTPPPHRPPLPPSRLLHLSLPLSAMSVLTYLGRTITLAQVRASLAIQRMQTGAARPPPAALGGGAARPHAPQRRLPCGAIPPRPALLAKLAAQSCSSSRTSRLRGAAAPGRPARRHASPAPRAPGRRAGCRRPKNRRLPPPAHNTKWLRRIEPRPRDAPRPWPHPCQVGALGSLQLSALSLASSVYNITGLSLVMGVASGAGEGRPFSGALPAARVRG